MDKGMTGLKANFSNQEIRYKKAKMQISLTEGLTREKTLNQSRNYSQSRRNRIFLEEKRDISQNNIPASTRKPKKELAPERTLIIKLTGLEHSINKNLMIMRR